MARIVMAANGSWGDVLPFVAVAHRLIERGHDVVFVLPSSFHARIGGEGLAVRPAGWEVGPDELAALDIDWSRAGGVVLMRAVLRQLVLPQLDHALAALETACDGADLLVCHVNQVMGPTVAARTGMPLATLSLFPMLVPTVEGLASAPMPRLPGAFRKLGNRLVLAATLAAARPVFYDRQFNRFRTRLGLRRHRAYFLTAALLADRYLALIPPSFAPRPTDWPTHVQLTGFCAWDGARHAAVPRHVDDYLAGGDPPVLVTMGSALSAGLTAVLQHVAADLDRRDVRALFLVGDRHLAGPLGGRADVAEFAPLDQVLSRCRAVVHHGGYGTTAATLRAGLPAVTVSPMPDQLWFGRRVEALGAGIALSWRRRRHVADAVDQILTVTSYATAAADYRDRTRRHDGIAETCNELETLVAI